MYFASFIEHFNEFSDFRDITDRYFNSTSKQQLAFFSKLKKSRKRLIKDLIINVWSLKGRVQHPVGVVGLKT